MKTKPALTGQAALASERTRSPAAARQRILVPIDFSPSSISALRYADGLAAGQREAHLILLNVVEEPASFRTLDVTAQRRSRQQAPARELHDFARRELGANMNAQMVVREGIPTREITRVATHNHADLIVVGRHEHRGLRRWFGGHTANRVANSAPCPVVILARDHPEPAPYPVAA